MQSYCEIAVQLKATQIFTSFESLAMSDFSLC